MQQRKIIKVIKNCELLPAVYKEKFLARLSACSEKDLVRIAQIIQSLEQKYAQMKFSFYKQLNTHLQNYNQSMQIMLRWEIEKHVAAKDVQEADMLLSDLSM